MKIENRVFIVKVWLRNLTLSILFVTLLSIFVISRAIEEGALIIPKGTLILSICVIFISYLISSSLKKYNYLYFEDDGKDLIIRFYRLTPFASKKSYVIPKAFFHSYRIEKKLKGYRKEITFFQKSSKGIVKYPPLSLSALSQNELTKLEKWLNFYIEQNSSVK